MLTVFAPAKVNLCLHVTGRRGDGYHLLDSIVGFADVGDVLTLRQNARAGLDVMGPEAGLLQGGPNIITRTLAEFGAADLHVTLDKRLPVASGIGGGSADAAAVYRGLNALMGRAPAPQDAARLLGLGADVPMCVSCQPAHVSGIGERIIPLPDLPALAAVLVNPRVPVATPDVFRALMKKENAAIAPIPQKWADSAAFTLWLADQRNDLQTPAMAIAPAIGDVLAALAYSGARLARMSGSGATCFGLYDSASAAQHAAQTLRQNQPTWWIAPCTLNGASDVMPQAMRATT